MGEPRVTLILVTHDSARWLRAFVESWRVTLQRAPELEAGGAVEVIVADAGSGDETRKLAAELLPGAMVLALENVGFGAAANRAMAAARGPWALLCNPDLTFPPEFAEVMLKPLMIAANGSANGVPEWLKAGAACVAPKLLNADGSPQASVGRFPTASSVLIDQFRARGNRKYSFSQPQRAGPVDWASGACMLVHRARFQALGGFDEQYFLYVEEVDLQRRLFNAGHRTWFFPEATVVHHQPNAQRTPRPQVQRWAARGLLRYFAKFGTRGSLLAYRLMAFARGRLGAGEAFARREKIVDRVTGP